MILIGYQSTSKVQDKNIHIYMVNCYSPLSLSAQESMSSMPHQSVPSVCLCDTFTQLVSQLCTQYKKLKNLEQ